MAILGKKLLKYQAWALAFLISLFPIWVPSDAAHRSQVTVSRLGVPVQVHCLEQGTIKFYPSFDNTSHTFALGSSQSVASSISLK